MHIFEIKSITHRAVEATLLATNNPYINGRIIAKTEYRSQEQLIVGNSYVLLTDAIKTELSSGNVYEVTGSWIKGQLHLTGAKEKAPGSFAVIEGRYTEMV